MNQKKYTIDELAICNWEQIEIFPKAKAKHFDGLLFCSQKCLNGYKKDFGMS